MFTSARDRYKYDPYLAAFRDAEGSVLELGRAVIEAEKAFNKAGGLYTKTDWRPVETAQNNFFLATIHDRIWYLIDDHMLMSVNPETKASYVRVTNRSWKLRTRTNQSITTSPQKGF